LRELTFSTENGKIPGFPHGFAVMLNPFHLREFDALEILRTQTIFFDFDSEGPGVGRETFVGSLPQSIRQLDIRGLGDIAPALQALAEAIKAGQFKHLQIIDIDDQRLGFQTDLEQLSEAECALCDLGVEVGVNDPYDGEYVSLFDWSNPGSGRTPSPASD
jgi:hypothetical protein